MRKLFLLLLASISTLTYSQIFKMASLKEDMTVGVRDVPGYTINKTQVKYSQMPGFPKAFPANPSFKNMRNLTLADVNDDGVEDILFCADSKLYAYSYQGLIWEQTLTGTAIYPPSVGDVNGDGQPDIVQVTGGQPANGRIYVFDKSGNILSGWPLNFNNNWIICAPALSDIDNDGKMEIIVNERLTPAGKTHILKYDGSSFSTAWPVTLDGIPAVTPSVGDVDGDGQKDIVVCSTKSRYVLGLDGQPKTGFPLTTAPNQSYSYQSPVLADFNNDNKLEIVGATHGDAPQFYVMNYDNSDYQQWPVNVPDSSWTYSPPTVVKINGDWRIFMSRPIGSDTLDMLYGWDHNGNMLPDFPIVKSGGLEGYTAIADIDNDNEFEIVFGSNLKDNNGEGFIHAYNMDGSGELAGFPLKPTGFTFMNGVCIGDVNGDAQTDLVALSYSLNFGSEPDSVYINVYETQAPYDKSKVLWGTYKGSNTRTGLWSDTFLNINSPGNTTADYVLYPNPVEDILHISNTRGMTKITVYDILGREVLQHSLNANRNAGADIKLGHLEKGLYLIVFSDRDKISGSDFILKQ